MSMQAPVQEHVDVAANRLARKYAASEILRRVAWALVQPLFRFSPRPCFAWRRLLLRLFGARVGHEVHVYPTSQIYYPWMLEIGDQSAIGEHALIYNLGPVKIGRWATISHRTHLCAGTHDYTDPAMPLLKPPIEIGDDAWICAEAFIGPGVHVGNGAVVGACSAVFKDVVPWTVVGGNPAKAIKSRGWKSTQAFERSDGAGA